MYLLEENCYVQQLNVDIVNFYKDRFEVSAIFNKKGKDKVTIYGNNERGKSNKGILEYAVNVENNSNVNEEDEQYEEEFINDNTQNLEEKSLEKVSYKGKEYTKYEATQVQRKLETAIRKQKDRQIIARASGDSVGISNAQEKITQLTSEYNNFSKSVGLDTYKNRLTVSGYKRVAKSKLK